MFDSYESKYLRDEETSVVSCGGGLVCIKATRVAPLEIRAVDRETSLAMLFCFKESGLSNLVGEHQRLQQGR